MKSGLKLALITLPIILIGVGVLAYIVTSKPAPQQHAVRERAVAVRVIIAKTQPVAPLASGFGLVRPARTYEAITQVGGIADYVNPMLQKGAILPAGEVLLRLSPVDFNLAIAQARANIRAAEARLAELTVSAANQTSALVIEQKALALKARELERAESLFAGGTVAQSTRDNARSAHLAQQQKVQSVESSLALMPTQREVQIEQIAVYQATLETATLNLERTELTLPFAGRVASTSVEVGQFVRAGQTAALLDGVQAAEVEAQMTVADMGKVLQIASPTGQFPAFDPSKVTKVLRNLGLKSRVRLRFGDQVVDWPATLDRISDTIDPKTGTLGVIVRVDTAYSGATPGERPPLTKGMFVQVSLSAPPINGIVIPRNALRDGHVLLADADDRLQLIAINPHLLQGETTLITEGLEPGMRVVVSAVSPMVPGLLLSPVTDRDLMAKLASSGARE